MRRATVTVIGFTLVAKTVGLVREAVVAATFGTTQIVDLYLAAVTVPALLSSVLYQALPNAFVPLFADSGHEAGLGRRRNAWAVLGAMGIASAALWLFSDPVSYLTSAGFPPLLRVQCALLLKIASGVVLLSTVEALLRSRLIAQRRFAQSGAGSILLNMTIIAAVLLFTEGRAQTLVWGLVAGTAAVTVWNYLPLGRGSRQSAGDSAIAAEDPSRLVGRWITLVLLINVLGMFFGLIDRYFGSFLAEGSIAALQYAVLIASQPVSLCGAALGIAVFPYLSAKSAVEDYDAVAEILDRAIRWALLGAVPAAVVMIAFGDEIVTILFERGQFDASSRVLTGGLLSVYGTWLVPATIAFVVSKVYYATRRWRPLLVAMIAGLIVKAALSYWWVRTYGVGGLPAATSVTVTVYTALLLIALPAWCRAKRWRGWLRNVFVLTGIFVVASVGGRTVVSLLPSLPPVAKAALGLGTASVLGIVILWCAGSHLGVSEVSRIRSWVAGRRKRDAA